MYPRVRVKVISALLLALPLIGCDSGTEPRGTLGDLNPGEVESAVNDLMTPIQGMAAPTTAVKSAFPTLTEQGLTFDRADQPALEGIPARTVPDGTLVAPDVVIPLEIQGRTFAYDTAAAGWAVDSTRTDAPADGVRVIWYRTDPSGRLLVGEEAGYVDLTDEDDGGSSSAIGIRMVATTDSGTVAIAEITESLALSDSSEDFGALGYYGGGTERIDFSLTSYAATDTATGDHEFAVVVDLDGPAASYTLDITGTETGATGAVEQNVLASVNMNGVTTELDLDLAVDETGSQSGTGTLSHDNTERARITVEENDFGYTDADGEALDAGQAGELDSLVRVLFLAGLEILTRMPLLFL